MGIYFRRSKKIGPFRITLSKRGISTSIGDSHFRLTKGTRGTYVSSTLAGVTMRERLDVNSTPSTESQDKPEQPTVSSQPTVTEPPVAPTLSADEINARLDSINKDRMRSVKLRLFYYGWFFSLIAASYFIDKLKGAAREDGMMYLGFYGMTSIVVFVVLYFRAKRRTA